MLEALLKTRRAAAESLLFKARSGGRKLTFTGKGCHGSEKCGAGEVDCGGPLAFGTSSLAVIGSPLAISYTKLISLG